VPPSVVAERRRRLLALERELADTYARRLVGRRLDVLVEGEAPTRPGWAQGTSCRQVPVWFPAYVPALLGRRVPVVVEAVAEGALIGHPVAEPVGLRLLESKPQTDRAGRGRLALPQVAAVPGEPAAPLARPANLAWS